MYFKQSDIQEAKSHITKRVEELNVIIDAKDDARFHKVIGTILKAKQYYVGEQIDPMHMTALKHNVNIIITNLSNYLVKNADNLKDSTDLSNPVEYLNTAVDALFITAMEKLGCPDMPIMQFDPEIKKTLIRSAMEIHRSYVTYDISKDDILLQQRGKDASVVLKSFRCHMDGIKNEKKPESVGKMIAEYQALKVRQKNHNVFWRIFHRTENKARNDLLVQMSDAIKAQLPKGMKNMNLDEAIPALVTREIADARIRGDVEVAGLRRFTPETATRVFGCSPSNEDIADQHKLFSEFSQKESMSKDANFLNDIIGMDNPQADHAVKKETAKNDKIIFKEDNDAVRLS